MTNISPKLLDLARETGRLSLANRKMGSVPDEVWLINYPSDKNRICSGSGEFADDATKWWEQKLLFSLNLSSNGLTTVSGDVSKLKHLNFLDLSDNLLTSLPEKLSECKSLQRLLLAHNRFEQIPSSVYQLHDLRILKVNNNDIKAVSPELGSLFYLEEFNCSNNKLTELPSEISATRITKLDLSYNKLVSLPEEISVLQSVRTMDISHNCMTVLPDTLGLLENLETIYLSFNCLETLPVLKRATKLKELHASNNRIKHLAEDFFDFLPGLIVLDMQQNHLQTIPSSLLAMKNLERCNLKSNDLTAVPPEISLISSLKAIGLSDNPIRSLRKDVLQRSSKEILEYLKSKLPAAGDTDVGAAEDWHAKERIVDQSRAGYFDFSNKSANEIPASALDCIRNKTEIKRINLQGNKFQEIPECVVFNFAGQVEDLDLSQNSLLTLDRQVEKFALLQCLNVSRNRLSDLPDSLISCKYLRELDLSSNMFTRLPAVIGKCLNLEVLRVQNNKVESIDVDALLGLEKLSLLDVSNNSISKVPPELGNLVNLKSLHLEGNLFRVPSNAVLSKGTAEILLYLRNRIM